MKPIVFNDGFDCFYLYSFYKNKIVNIDNLLYELIKKCLNENKSIDLAISSLKLNDHDANLDYAIKRFHYLKRQGFFRSDNPYTMTGRLVLDDVRVALSNLKSITFELTQKCNFKCKYCVYRDLYKTSVCEKKDLSFEVAKAVIDYFYERFDSEDSPSVNRGVSIGFYGGEPLLKFDLLKQIVCYSNSLKSNRFYFHYNMTTNGYLLDKYLDFIVESDITLLVSLDGDFDTSKYRQTQKDIDSYPKVFNNLMEMKDRYPDYFRDKVSFNAVFHNKSDIINVLTFFKENFDKIPMLSELTSVSLKKEYEETYNCMFQSVEAAIDLNENKISPLVHHEINPVLPRAFKFIENYGGSHYGGYKHLLADNIRLNHIPTASCTPFANKLFVSADGKFHPCEKVGYEYPLGFVNESFLVEIDPVALVNRYNSYYDRIAKKCTKCYKANSCTICLFQREMDCHSINRKQMINHLKNGINSIKKNLSILNVQMNSMR